MGKSKKNVITIKEEDFKDSKFSKREWERNVNIVSWEHDFENKVYKITIM